MLDMSRVLAGPWASQLLADYGADVIKIERPGSGDDTRLWGPPWLADSNGSPTAESAYFLSTNRNKRSVTADLGTEGGQGVVRDLAKVSDILIENFRVGTLARYGLDADNLHKLNPRLVFCSISAYGQTGSRRLRPGYDAMIQAEAGLMSITGAPDTEGGRPQKVGVAIADIMTGMYAVTAILAALQARQRDGRGQSIDLCLYQSQAAWLANQAQNYLMTGRAPTRLGTAHPNLVPYQTFETTDDEVMLAIGNDRQFAACVGCMGLAHLAADTRFSNNDARVRHRSELIAMMAERVRQKSSAHWLTEMAAAGVPAGRINDLHTVFSDEFAVETQLVRQLPHALAAAVPTVSNPVSFSRTPVEYRHAAPLLGQHTDEVLREVLHYSAVEIQSLRRDGAI